MEFPVDTAAYGPRVIERFETPLHAGRPAGAEHCGEAVSKPRASRVRLHLVVRHDRVVAAGFEALGCPFTIAAADLVCADLKGRPLANLAGYDAGFLDAALPLPPDRLDIRILVEDAVHDAAGD